MLPGPQQNRRDLLHSFGLGFGALALNGLLRQEAGADSNLDFQPRARAVIQLFQNGGPSQMELFDPKPELNRRAGQPHPGEVETFQLNNKNVILGSQFEFQQYGECGMDFGSPLPHMAALADQWCMVRSMYTVNNNHPFAISMFQSGRPFFGFPAIGSWITYALGTENSNLPGYVVLRDPEGYNTSGKTVWSSGWLPAIYQGTEFGSGSQAVAYLHRKQKLPPTARARTLALLDRVNRRHRDLHPGEDELTARIENYQLAARMQLEAGTLTDLSRETSETRELYGLDNPVTSSYGKRCLLARRLIESGVRYVQIFPPLKPSFQPWDSHANLKGGITTISEHVDRPTAALVTDLKRRGLLDEVIVIWTGEFGRLPITENSNGRDHNRHAFTTLLAGGGFRGGHIHGATDEFGYQAVEDRVSVPDLHATLLRLMGIDHKKLAYRHRGRDERLTDPEVTGARVVKSLLA